jgi:hypothetical protein
MYRSSQQALETLQGTGLHYRIMLHSPMRDLLWYSAKILPRFPFNKKRPPINLTDVLRAPSHARKRTYEHIILRGEFFADITGRWPPRPANVSRKQHGMATTRQCDRSRY